ncbi:hypothetical protein TNCV_3421321 [Trichonephila clavipes]|nr:hypothetical protein TNCV_3421321 [Trichonephila clavipes]
MGVGGWGFDIVDLFEEMEGSSCVWAEDDVAIAVGIFVLCLIDSGAKELGTVIDDDTNIDSEKELSLKQNIGISDKLKKFNQKTIQKPAISKTIGREIDLFKD